jgi:hypothetical protein
MDMSSRRRGVLKVLYYIIFIIVVFIGFNSSDKEKDILGIALLGYIIFGALLSIYLKLPLLNRYNFFSVSERNYSNWDTLVNLLFILMSVGGLIYSFLTSL